MKEFTQIIKQLEMSHNDYCDQKTASQYQQEAKDYLQTHELSPLGKMWINNLLM